MREVGVEPRPVWRPGSSRLPRSHTPSGSHRKWEKQGSSDFDSPRLCVCRFAVQKAGETSVQPCLLYRLGARVLCGESESGPDLRPDLLRTPKSSHRFHALPQVCSVRSLAKAVSGGGHRFSPGAARRGQPPSRDEEPR